MLAYLNPLRQSSHATFKIKYVFPSVMLSINFSPKDSQFKTKNPNQINDQDFINYVGPIGLEPILFCTKNKRVTSYTIGQNLIRECKFNTKFYLYKHFLKIISNTLRFLKKHMGYNQFVTIVFT